MLRSTTLQKLFKSILFFLVFLSFSTNLCALDSLPQTITFSSGSDGGFNHDDGDYNELRLKKYKDRSTERTFHFGSQQSINISFDVRVTNSWEDTGSYKDYFYFYVNGDRIFRTRYGPGDSETKEFTVLTDSSGDLRLTFRKITTGDDEYLYIDNLSLSSETPAIPIDLSIDSFSAAPDPVDAGSDLIYTTELSNVDATATNVVFTLSLSNGTYKSVSSGWSCNGSSNIVCTKNSDFSAGTSSTIEVTVTAPATSQTLTADASVNANQTDSDNSNNNASTSTQVQQIFDGQNDICYVAPTNSSGFSFPNTTTVGINNTSGSNLTNTSVVIDTSGFGSFMSNCSIDGGTLGDNCQNESNYQFGPASFFSKATTYDLGNLLKTNDANHTVEQVAMFDMTSINSVYATYTKNGKQYRSTLSKCGVNIEESLRDFQLRNPENTRIIQGDIKVIGNTVLCVHDSNGNCYNYTGNSSNAGLDLKYIDIDNDSTTFNSSKAKVEIPNNATILWAAIYTQGYLQGKNATEADTILRQPVYVDTSSTGQFPSGATTINIFPNDNDGYTYATYNELSQFIGKTGTELNGWVTVSNVKAYEGKDSSGLGNFGAWTIVLVYEDDDASYKNISVFDGYRRVADATGFKDVQININGFMTPKSGDINSSMAIFVGEGDKNIEGDKLYFDGNSINTINAFNSSISNVTRDPSYTNNQGIDIQNHDVSSYMQHKQTSATIRLTSTQDTYFPSLITFATDIYVPEFCYDYAYRQNDIYFTELNDGTKDPRIVGNVASGSPVEMGLYIKNKVDSDMSVDNFFLNIDINNSQALYIRNTTQVTPINEIYPEDIPDSYLSVSDAYIRNIPIGSIESNGYFYTYYHVNPIVSSLDMPLDVSATYDLNVNNTIIPYTLKLGKKIPLCTDNNFRYTPAKSIFNIVHNSYYNYESGGSEHYYNLPTQVVDRPGNFKVVAFDPVNLDTPINVSTVVAVDMVDLAAFHDSNASCQQLSSAISPRVWIALDATNAVSFDKAAIQQAIADGMTSITDANAFYNQARPNATFRITFNITNDGNDSLVQTQKQSNGTYKVLNFNQLTGGGAISRCTQTVYSPQGGNYTDQRAVACGNAGNGISAAQLHACMECVYGYNTKFICSRDNFAIRPEAFSISMNDQNQTDGTAGTHISNDTQQNIAAGYKYFTDINATTHVSSMPAKGYSYVMEKDSNSIGFTWYPRSTITPSSCNDLNNSYRSMKFSNGYLETNSSIDQVGEYRYEFTDKTYASVDSNASFMTHHTGIYYLDSSISDCLTNSGVVRSQTYPSVIYPNTAFLNGCYITSDHNNTDYPSLKYKRYDLTVLPYKFDISSIDATVGPNFSLVDMVNNNSYIYMEDLSQDNNMSMHLNGFIAAQGYNGSELSNFVSGCFAHDLKITLNKSDVITTVPLQDRFINLDENGNVLRVDTQDYNATDSNISLDNSDFIKTLKGVMNTRINLNFQRTKNTALNPKKVILYNYEVNCSTLSECAMNANNLTQKTPTGYKEFNANVKYFYGRSHAARQKFVGSGNHDVNISYEIYCSGEDCNKSLLPDGDTSKYNDDPRWFINTSHTATYGTAGDVEQKGSSAVTVSTQPTGAASDTAAVQYDESHGYPYITTMENNASNWLIYNPFDPTVTKNDFVLEFYLNGSGYVGSGESSGSVDPKRKSSATEMNRNKSWW